MRILVLTKRQYMGKDLLDDRFGRFWELPLELARRGHDVQGISLSYRKRSQGSFKPSIDFETGSITWHSVNLLNAPWPGPRRYSRFARQLVRDFQPEVIWACSDAYHAIFGHRLAKDSTAKLVVDLYDNFESYPATRIPGVLPLFKRAVKAADGVTCVSPQLANYMSERYRSVAPALVLGNAIRADLFRPMEREACRKQLGLPPAAKIIGTAGALYATRGIDTLYRGFEILAAEEPNLHLAVAGARPSRIRIPRGEHIHDLGVLPLDEVSILFNALDVAVICNRDSSFGRFNYPQKAREIIACGVPLVAARVGTMNNLLSKYPELRFVPDDPQSLAQAVRRQLAKPIVIESKTPTWADMTAELESFFLKVRNARP